MTDTLDANRRVVDFDHHAPEHVHTAHDNYRHMRSACPVFWSERHGGFWGLTRYEDVARLSKEKDAFSARKTFEKTGAVRGGITIPTIPHFHLVPNETEDPEWQRYRAALGPLFTPRAIALLKDKIHGYTTALLDQFIERGEIDLVLDLGNPLPAIITLDLIGLPLDQWHKYAAPWHVSAYAPIGSEEAAYAEQGIRWAGVQLAELIQETRRQGGADNLVGALVRSDGSGRPFTDDEILNLLIQVLAGGVDTTTAATVQALFHMHEHHELRRELAGNQALMATAVEEFMRYTTPIQTISRTITREIELAGQKVCPGERALLAIASANRDSKEFERPDEVVLNRFPNRHLAFGLGTHRCLGSSLARSMFSAMVGQVLERMPDYVVIEAASVRYPTMSVINSWIKMPARFSPGKKVGTGVPLPFFDSDERHDYSL